MHLRRLVVGVLALAALAYENRPEELARREADVERQGAAAQLAHCLDLAHIHDDRFDAYWDDAGTLRTFGRANLFTGKLEDTTAPFQFDKCMAQPVVVDQVPAGYQRWCEDDLCSRWHFEALR